MFGLRDIIGMNIRSFRLERDWSQEELAHQADISASHLGKIERGEQNFTIDTLERIAMALGVSAERLVRTDAQSDQNTQTLLEQFQQMPMQLSYCAFPHQSVSPDYGTYMTYGIVAFYVQGGIPQEMAIHDICIRKKAIERFSNVLNAIQLPPQHLFDAVEDFTQNDYIL